MTRDTPVKLRIPGQDLQDFDYFPPTVEGARQWANALPVTSSSQVALQLRLVNDARRRAAQPSRRKATPPRSPATGTRSLVTSSVKRVSSGTAPRIASTSAQVKLSTV